MNRILLPCWALAILLLGNPEVGLASGTVTNCTESDLHVALRGGGSVVLACDSTITLSQPLLIGKPTIIDGAGHQAVITSSFSSTNNSGPLFVVQPGASLVLRSITVTGVSVTSSNSVGGAAGFPALGAALLNNQGNVTLDGCTFSDQTVTAGSGSTPSSLGVRGGDGGLGAGAAVYNLDGELLVTNCVFSGNSAVGGSAAAGSAGSSFANGGAGGTGGNGGNGGSGRGAAIYNTTAGVITIYDSLFASNRVVGGAAGTGGSAAGLLGFSGTPGVSGPGLGAAIFNDGGRIGIINSTFVGNSGTGAAGVSGTAGTGTLQPSQGSAGGSALGGGLFNFSGMVTLTNCTFVENSMRGGQGGTGGAGRTSGFGGSGASGGSGGDALGAGLYNAAQATTIVVNNTFTDNSILSGTGGSGGAGSGIGGAGGTGNKGNQAGAALFNAGGVLEIRNSILANSISGSNAAGAISDLGYNLSSDATPSLSAQGSRNHVDALLGSYSTAGGSVPTITLATNSPAVNAINAPNNNGAPAFDERQALRVAPYDIGAYELNGAFAAPNLQVQLATNQVALSWPAVGDFLLQSTTNLVSGTNNLGSTNQWVTIPTTPTTANGLNTVLVDPTNQASFFRLVNP